MGKLDLYNHMAGKCFGERNFIEAASHVFIFPPLRSQPLQMINIDWNPYRIDGLMIFSIPNLFLPRQFHGMQASYTGAYTVIAGHVALHMYQKPTTKP